MALREVKQKRQEITGEIQSEEEAAIRAEVQSRKERMGRANACGEKVNKLLAEDNCELMVFFQIGDNRIPASQIVALPTLVSVAAK